MGHETNKICGRAHVRKALARIGGGWLRRRRIVSLTIGTSTYYKCTCELIPGFQEMDYVHTRGEKMWRKVRLPGPVSSCFVTRIHEETRGRRGDPRERIVRYQPSTNCNQSRYGDGILQMGRRKEGVREFGKELAKPVCLSFRLLSAALGP